MNIKILMYIGLSIIITIAACQPAVPSSPTAAVEVIEITENENRIGEIQQVKTFDQCESSSTFSTEVQFSNNNAKTNQQQLTLGAEVTGGIELPTGVKAEISGSIQKQLSETIMQGDAHSESARIEVPAHTQQVYTLVWQETRREGTVTYIENSQTKTVDYSYRVGLEMVKVSSKDIPCPSISQATTTLQPSTFAPVILDIKTRRTGSSPSQIILADINFSDEDGDAYIVKYTLSGTTVRNVFNLKYSDDLILDSSDRQKAGTKMAVQWNCAGTGYTATFDVIILDSAGNQSNIFPITFDCR